MTARLRPITRPRRERWHGEDRQDFLVTVGFGAVIVLLLLILGGVVAITYYDAHIRAIAQVGGTAITRDDWGARGRLMAFRLNQEERRIREAITMGDIDPNEGLTRIQSLQGAQQQLPSLSITTLVDLVYQSQLAAEQGITVSDADVEERITAEASTPERRRVAAIFVAPEVSEGEGEPTREQRAEAREQAEEALAALEDGEDFAEVAERYSTDPSREVGGDYGELTRISAEEPAWLDALFRVEEGETTDVIVGSDGTYRIGRVTDVIPGEPAPIYLEELQAQLSMDAYRRNVRYELTSDRLRENITDEAVSAEAEQVNLAEIFIASPEAAPEDPEQEEDSEQEEDREPELHLSHILYSPGNDPGAGAELPEDDPAWAEAEEAAQAAADELNDIEDVDDRMDAFGDRAREESDDDTNRDEGGDLGFAARGSYVEEFANAAWEGDHERGDVIGPVRTQFGYHVILWQDERGSAEDRVKEVIRDLAEPGATFEDVAREHSDGPEGDAGGELGWFTADQLEPEVEEVVLDVPVGEISTQVRLADGFHIYKVLDREERPRDADQRQVARQNAFSDWYDPKREEAQNNGTIRRDESIFDEFDTGADPNTQLPGDPGALPPGDGGAQP